MKAILIGLLLSVPAVLGQKEKCEDTREIESNCASYCFKAVKPILDYTKFMQSQMEDLKHRTEYLDKFEKWNSQISDQMEIKFDLQDKKFEQKLEDLRGLIGAKTDRRPFQKIGSKYYYIERTTKLNWFQALHKCIELGGHLVSIKNVSEFNAITAELQPRIGYWIDLNDLGTEGVFLSVATGLQPTYVNWHPNNPGNYGNVEHCGDLWWNNNKFLMNDNKCNVTQLFVCEPHNQ